MLKVDNIQVSYGNVKALFGISLSIRQGEMVALIGANGAGKSTTLKAILGLVPTSSGRIEFMGKRIDNLPTSEIVKRGIALSPEGRRLWPEMTVRENLELGAFVRRGQSGIKKDIDRIFDYFPILKERQDQMGGSLSGGEQQMVSIGRALMGRPKVLMLDEPSLGLSPIFVEKVKDIILSIHESGRTVLLVEQNAFLALKMSNRAYALEVGKIATEGYSKDLIQDEHIKTVYLGKKVKKQVG